MFTPVVDSSCDPTAKLLPSSTKVCTLCIYILHDLFDLKSNLHMRERASMRGPLAAGERDRGDDDDARKS
jgi:hypothetical protein